MRGHVGSLAILMALGLSGSAGAEVAASPKTGAATAEKVILRPVWEKRPDGEALAKFYPGRAV